MNTSTAQVDDLRLIALPSAVNCTDMFVRFSLSEWSLPSLYETATQLASQLVTAAVDSANPKSPGLITVRLRLSGEALRIEVEDEEAAEPPEMSPHLADGRCGSRARTDGGCVAWCELDLPTGLSANSVPLPRRNPKRSEQAETPAEKTSEIDPEVIQRLLTGLSKFDG